GGGAHRAPLRASLRPSPLAACVARPAAHRRGRGRDPRHAAGGPPLAARPRIPPPGLRAALARRGGADRLRRHRAAAPAGRAPRPRPPAPPEGPPQARLQTTPAEDLAQLRAREDTTLDGYGWEDRTAGVVHIPIARAMELVAKEAAK